MHNHNKKLHLTYEERFCIEKMLRVGNGLASIAQVLGRGVSTLSQEIGSNGGRKAYRADKADKKAKLNQSRKKMGHGKLSSNTKLLNFILDRIKEGNSPETISKLTIDHNHLPYISGKSIRKYLKEHKV